MTMNAIYKEHISDWSHQVLLWRQLALTVAAWPDPSSLSAKGVACKTNTCYCITKTNILCNSKVDRKVISWMKYGDSKDLTDIHWEGRNTIEFLYAGAAFR